MPVTYTKMDDFSHYLLQKMCCVWKDRKQMEKFRQNFLLPLLHVTLVDLPNCVLWKGHSAWVHRCVIPRSISIHYSKAFGET